MPKFSVVIPLYNKARYIVSTVQSVLGQTYDDFELIVVDDGSTDGGYDLLSGIDDKRVKLLRQSNGGVSVARNTGIEHSSGEYIAFLDADDLWYPDYLSKINKLTWEYAQADIFVTSYRVVMSEGRFNLPNRCFLPESGLRNYWLSLTDKYDFVWTSVTTVRREALVKAGGFKPGERIGQDLDLWARLAGNNPSIAYTSACCADYNRSAENNARTRVRVVYAEAFINDLISQLKCESRTDSEKKCILKKLRKKLVVYIFTLSLSGFRADARKKLKEFRQYLGVFYSFALYISSLMPSFVNKSVYSLRLKVF